MQRMIPVDKLARPEDHILLPATRTRNDLDPYRQDLLSHADGISKLDAAR